MNITIDWCKPCMSWSITCPECGQGATCNCVENCETCKKINRINQLIPFGSELDRLITDIVEPKEDDNGN